MTTTKDTPRAPALTFRATLARDLPHSFARPWADASDAELAEEIDYLRAQLLTPCHPTRAAMVSDDLALVYFEQELRGRGGAS